MRTEPQDKEICYILGMCQMPDGSIVFADFNNCSLKQMDSDFNVIKYWSLSREPCDVCHTEGSQVAVALLGNTITLVSLGENLPRSQTFFSTNHNCNSLAYSHQRLYVIALHGTNVYVYNMSGSQLHTISTDKMGGQMLFSSTHCITNSPDSSWLYIADEKGLITIDTEGNLLNRFTSPELVDGPFAACVDGVSNVFVGGCSSNNVLQLRQQGDRKVAEILSHSDETDIRTLCFDGVKCRLLISSKDNDTVQMVRIAHVQSN